ncbi:MAG TPA: hypothetical protein VLB83_00950 [Candidatus Paceibacterota bacterium]|nr:hypothetical protein [Candidatus Paceibacterota bacterium]
MSLLKKKIKSGQHFILVFDIGSGSIGGSFVSVDSTKTPEIIFSTRQDIPFQEKLNFSRFLESMITTLEEMFVSLQKAGGNVVVDQAFCVLASPWYASQTRIIKYSRPTPFQVTEKGMSKLVQREIELFRSSKLFTRSKVGDTSPEIMEAKNIQMKLNGYEVRYPFGKKVTELEIALYISMIPSNIYTSINESIRKFWHVEKVHFSSFAFTAFDTIRDIFIDEESFLFIDVAGEVTDISLAKENVLLESISFPAGRNMLIRALVDELKTNPANAASELTLYLEGKATREHSERIEAVLTDATNEWLVYLEDALTQFATEFPIPRTIFYTADDDVTRWFERAMGRIDSSKFGIEEGGAFAVRFLGTNFLSKFAQVHEPSFQDPFLSIETIFANKFTWLTKR